MYGSRLVYRALVGLAACLIAAPPAPAGTIPADALPLPNRTATADLVVIGKITGFEEKTVRKDRTEYKIATLTVSHALRAPQGTKSVHLGSVVIPPMVAIRPTPFQATEGQEGCYFLTKGSDAHFYVVGTLCFLDKKRPDFDKDIKLIKRCVKLLQDPDAALKCENAEDRFLTAGMLVARYTTRRTANAKTEPIDAEQSNRILQALASADWTPTTNFAQLSPQMVLGRLPLTDKDGWSPPSRQDAKAYAAYAQRWLKEHADTYRIQRFVAEKRN
jgi:hypothetical protein